MAGHPSRLLVVLCGVIVAACTSSPAPTESPPAPHTPEPSPTAVLYPPSTIGAFPPLSEAVLPAGTVAALDAALEAGVELGEAQAVAASVIVPGVGGWSGVVGDDGSGDRVEVDAQFAIASITKTVVAAQVLALAEDGLLDLDAPLGAYLPAALEVDTNDATVREFLAMRSGLAQVPRTAVMPLLAEDHDRAVTLDDVIPLLREPVAEAGERVEYNNLNYVLLGAAIASITGRPVAAALRSGVLATGDLDRLVYQDEERPQGPLAPPGPIDGVPDGTDLLELGGGYLPTRAIATSAGSAGGMASDAATLARWGYLLYGGFVLQPESLAAMTDVRDGYGLGTHVVDEFGLEGVGHSGGVPGYTSLLYADASTGVVIAVLASTEGWNPGITAGDLLRAVAGE